MIGISSKSVMYFKDWIAPLFNADFKAIEIDLSKTPLLKNEDIEMVRKLASEKSISLSVHAMIQLNFGLEDPIQKIIEDIKVARKIGAKELVFHISRNTEFDSEEHKKIIDTLINEAKINKIQLLLENNHRGNYSDHEHLLEILEKFPSIKFCLDVGHLQEAQYYGLKINKIVFIEKFLPYIEYLHVHDAAGKDKDHIVIGSGEINFKDIINLLNSKKDKKWIIEIDNLGDSIISRDLLIKKGLVP